MLRSMVVTVVVVARDYLESDADVLKVEPANLQGWTLQRQWLQGWRSWWL